jgi:hypothetical protein
MKRSTQVVTPLLAATALALLTGCRQPDMQRCVDENNKVVDDKLCQQQGQQPQQRPDGHGSFLFVPIYHYYYGGYGGYGLGTTVVGGSYTPIPGRTYSTTTRGGFGSSFGGGEGEGGGHGGGAGE